jgi:hypothetical protein
LEASARGLVAFGMRWLGYEVARADWGSVQVWCHDHDCDWEKADQRKKPASEHAE